MSNLVGKDSDSALKIAEKVVGKDTESIVLENNEIEIENVFSQSKQYVEQEKEISVLTAIRKYPREILWSSVFTLGVVMAGYDGQIIASFYSLPAFQKKFGVLGSDGTYPVQSSVQIALGMGSPIGQVIGCLFGAYPMEWFGRKWTYAATLICCIGFVFWQFFAPNIGVLIAGEIIGGLFWGVVVLIGPTYASEISQIKLRGVLTTLTNMGFVIGQFVANGVADGFATNTSKWAYKVPFAIQFIWPVLILVILPFAPESPYWLVRKGKMDAAKKSVRKICGPKASEEIVENRLMVIVNTTSLEDELEKSSSYWDLFKGSNLRRTEVATVVYSIQVFCGVPFAVNYSTYFFSIATDIKTSVSFDLALGSAAIGFAATCSAWVFLSYFGRRFIYNVCMVLLTTVLFVIGFLDCPKSYTSHESLAYAQASLMLVWNFIYQMSAGATAFTIISENSAMNVRSKTIAFATAVQALFFIVATVVVPYMLNPDNGNLRGKTGFVFGAFCFVCTVWSFFRLPETSGRSYEELDIMYHRGIPAREFKNYDCYAEINNTTIFVNDKDENSLTEL
ncbi:related to maltose permease [Saccharomycodes ludwigii]|uniref:Related to maltose permease n=1 Tax=Saccharomycodes ludwigii TaxID=36035 RepID=A0A376B0R7_9ASCO|nr:hypothetical protein SCDLUD_004976 [Saccharomycodes ludwigii]KAH3898654.1 hypothetical protein SCDLUD_004976 [Saccharomycodes ludwigii]SSD58257.1 related to maltose permease [Saccharomycodes ludwigii]